MDFLNDLLQYGYLSNALTACVLSGIACGIVGTYVVCRRMVFLAGGITHASFGGLGIAFWMGANPIGGALVFAVLSALGIEWAGSRGRIREDSAIGIIWSVGMAVGALFMSLRPGYTSGDLSAYLFGSIITVTREDVIALAALTLLILVGAALWLRPVMYVAFDREFARSRGIRTRVISYLMAALVAVTWASCCSSRCSRCPWSSSMPSRDPTAASPPRPPSWPLRATSRDSWPVTISKFRPERP